jgi:CubicO group peptidase (beta-lactamase class C family)
LLQAGAIRDPAAVTAPRSAVADAAQYAGEWVEYRQRTLRIPGVSVAVRHDDEVLLSASFGLADIAHEVPLTTGHLFRIASHSKVFTATAIMLLAERDELSLDHRVGQLLDWLPAGDGIGRRRVRDLLAHAGGVIRDGLDADFWHLARPFPARDALRASVVSEAPVLDVSESFKYSNIGYSILGQVIEAVTGVSYHDFVIEHIVQRLGLTSTGPEPGPDEIACMATGYGSRRYGLERVALPAVDTQAMASATGFYSTAEDLCRFGAAHFLGNTELLTDESKREMQHEHWKVEGSRGGHYGFGFQVSCIDDRRLVGHGGGFPGYITYTCIDPADRIVVSVLTNAIDGPAESLANGVVRLINRAVQQTTKAPAELGHAADLDRFTGRFSDLWTTTDIVRLDRQVLAINPDLPDPISDASELERVDAATLRIAKTSGYDSPGEHVRYERDADDQVIRVRYGGGTLVPWATFLETADQVRRGW